jgi:hypothetical protein
MKTDRAKSDVITWVAGLPESSAEFRAVVDLYRGVRCVSSGPDPQYYTLKQVAAKVARHPVWLSRLGVQGVGVRLGGRLAYRLADVVEFLKSDTCKQRLHEIHAERVRREGVQESRVA